MRQLLLAKEIGCKKDNTDLQKKLVESKRETESSIKLQNELHVKEVSLVLNWQCLRVVYIFLKVNEFYGKVR